MTRDQFVSFGLPHNLKVYDTVGDTILPIEFSNGNYWINVKTEIEKL